MTLAGRHPESRRALWLQVVYMWQRDDPDRFRRWQELARRFAAEGETRAAAGKRAWELTAGG